MSHNYPDSRKTQDIRERFFSKVLLGEGCWLWQGLTNKKGYGRFGVTKRGMHLAHRVAWEFEYGDIPFELCVLHKCDVPACVRPDHLFLGTRAENNDDMNSKGRRVDTKGDGHARRKHPENWPKGSRVPNARLLEKDVVAIRLEYSLGGCSFVTLAKRYGVGKTTIENIIARRKWKHV